MKILVIGGTLFIGRMLVRELIGSGHEVWVMHRKDTHDLGPEIGNLQADRTDYERVRKILHEHRFDAVFDNVYDFERGTTAEDVAQTARACTDSVERYVFMSSVAAYGSGLDHREEDELAPDDYEMAYVQHKASSERALFRMHREKGFPVITFRPPFVYGPGNPFYREAFFWDRLRDRRPIILPDDGSTLMQFVYVEDLAKACARVVDVPEAVGHAFNMAHYRPVTHQEAVTAMAKAAGLATPEFVYIPRQKIFEMGGHPMAGSLYFGEYFDMEPITETVEKAPRMLGVEPIDFEEGLRRGYEWYRTVPSRKVDYSFEDRLLAAV
jgi:2'-hydroxyisoflavone reductase